MNRREVPVLANSAGHLLFTIQLREARTGQFALDDVTRRQTTVNWLAHDKGSKAGSKQVAIPGYRQPHGPTEVAGRATCSTVTIR
jgi:hypothetical protein